jgi:hypothetical protein
MLAEKNMTKLFGLYCIVYITQRFLQKRRGMMKCWRCKLISSRGGWEASPRKLAFRSPTNTFSNTAQQTKGDSLLIQAVGDLFPCMKPGNMIMEKDAAHIGGKVPCQRGIKRYQWWFMFFPDTPIISTGLLLSHQSSYCWKEITGSHINSGDGQ